MKSIRSHARSSEDDTDVDDAQSTIQYKQVFEGMIARRRHDNSQVEFSRRDLMFGIRNPRTDWILGGYGISEVEDLINIITSYLFSYQYNSSFFTQGTVAKGFLHFKGEKMTQQALDSFRSMWRAMLTGVENCISGDTEIWTKNGAVSAANIVGEATEAETVIWTGTSWRSALVYKTKDPKVPVRTTLGNGVSIVTSPDHKFRILGPDGEPVWVEQRNLGIGDFVLVNKTQIDAGRWVAPTLCGKQITPELMEAIGWLTGDGYIAHSGRGHAKTNVAQWFYANHEAWIRDRHLAVLRQFADGARPHDKIVSDEDAEAICQRYGFRDVERVRLSIDLFSVDFTEGLLALGLRPSKKSEGGKVIPGFLHAAPSEYRAAFLRGFFSADGNNAYGRNPRITIANDRLREQTRLLLLSLGIRTSFGEGKTKVVINGTERGRINAKSFLNIKDRDRFFSEVGFLQPHKREGEMVSPMTSGKQSRVSSSTIMKFTRMVRAANKESGGELLTTRQRMDLNSILVGIDTCSLPRLLRIMATGGIEPPPWLTDYNFEPVVEIEQIGDDPVPMFDVAVYDDEHQFMGNGIAIHNSWKTPIVVADGANWVNMSQSNRDMEYSLFMDWLLKMICAIYGIAPEELGFQFGNSGQSSTMSEGSQEQKLKYGRDKGLVPLAKFFSEHFNRSIIWEIDPRFSLEFVGINAQTSGQIAEVHAKEVGSYRTVNEVRAEEGLQPLPGELGDVVLNAMWITNKQNIELAAQQAEMAEQQAQGKFALGTNQQRALPPADEVEKAMRVAEVEIDY